MEVFVGIEGFTLPSGFVAKEVCFLYPNWEFCHLLFKPPCDRHLSNIDRRTIRWTTNNLNNIFYQDGEVPYECLHDILKTLQLHTIWTYGEVAQRFLQDFLPTSIITNVQTLGYSMPSELPSPACFRQHNYRYCAKAKAIAVKNFIEFGQ